MFQGKHKSGKPQSVGCVALKKVVKISLGKALDITAQKCYNEYEKRRRTLHKPERDSIMRKVTFETIFTALTNFGYDNQEVMDELSKEINKGADAKAKNAEAYEGIHDLVIGALSDTPATCAEIFEQIKTELPEGMGKGKVQYALTHLWQDEIVKIEGKPNTYRRA